VTRLELHELPEPKRAGELTKLVTQLYRARRRIVIWVEDQGRLQILDDYLWTFEKLAFIPHAIWNGGDDQRDEPIVLTSEPVNPNGAQVLVVGDGFPPGEWAAGFDEVHDLIPPEDAGTERRDFWVQWRRDFIEEGSGG